MDLSAENKTERERSYVLNNTVYLIAQYVAWTEIIRRDIQHIDLGTEEETTQLARLQDNTYRLWQTDRSRFSRSELRPISQGAQTQGANRPALSLWERDGF